MLNLKRNIEYKDKIILYNSLVYTYQVWQDKKFLKKFTFRKIEESLFESLKEDKHFMKNMIQYYGQLARTQQFFIDNFIENNLSKLLQYNWKEIDVFWEIEFSIKDNEVILKVKVQPIWETYKDSQTLIEFDTTAWTYEIVSKMWLDQEIVDGKLVIN